MANVYVVHCLASFLDLRSAVSNSPSFSDLGRAPFGTARALCFFAHLQAMTFSVNKLLHDRLEHGMPHWWNMQYRIMVKRQRFGTAPITQPGVQREQLRLALRQLETAAPDSGEPSSQEGAAVPLQNVQRELVRANTQHFHELRAQQAMESLLKTVSMVPAQDMACSDSAYHLQPIVPRAGGGAAAGEAAVGGATAPAAAKQHALHRAHDSSTEYDGLVDKPHPFLAQASRRLRNMNMLEVYRALSKYLPAADKPKATASTSNEDGAEEGGPDAEVAHNPTQTISISPSASAKSSQTMGPSELRKLLQQHVERTSVRVRHSRYFLAELPQLKRELRDGESRRLWYDLFILGFMDAAVPLSIAWALLWFPGALQSTLDAGFGPSEAWWVPAIPFMVMCLVSMATFAHGLWCMLHDPLWLAGGESLFKYKEQHFQNFLQDCPPVPAALSDLNLSEELQQDVGVSLNIVAALMLGVRKPAAPFTRQTVRWREARMGFFERLWCAAPSWTTAARHYRWAPVGRDVAGVLFHTSCTHMAADKLGHLADLPAGAEGRQRLATKDALEAHAQSTINGQARSATVRLMVVSIVSAFCLFLACLLLTLRLTGRIELQHMRAFAPLLLAFAGTLDIPLCRARISVFDLMGGAYGSKAYSNYETVCLPGICGLGALPVAVYVAAVLGAVALGENLPTNSGFYGGSSVLLFLGGVIPGFPTVCFTALLLAKYTCRAAWLLVCCCPNLRAGRDLNFVADDDVEVVAGQWFAQVVWRLVHLQFLTVLVLMGLVGISTAMSQQAEDSKVGSPLHFVFILCRVLAGWICVGVVAEAVMRCRRNTVVTQADREGAFTRPGAVCGPPQVHTCLNSSPCACSCLCGARDGPIGLSAFQKDMLVLDSYEEWLTHELEQLRPTS